ncbi:MAG: DUF2520 domain-containing protein [Deltaproteobacteria bacterium]|nr:DUF2520 domain-containing protein [Deltaproteobacteria bacterium]
MSGSRIAILGCGAVGSALAAELACEGTEIVLWSRTRARAEAVAARLSRQDRAGLVVTEAVEAIEGAQLVLLCVTDAVLVTFAEEQANRAPRSTPGERAVVHTNGFHALEVLAPWRAVGWEAGKLHPLTSLPPDGGGRLRGAWFATASTEGGRPWIQRLLRALDGRELQLDDEEATSQTIHAAAALLSGGVVALFEVAASVARDAARDPDAAERAFLALLASTAGNLWTRGSRDALTGPAARGAAPIVQAHLKTLAAKDPDAAELYRRLGARMIALAAARGSIDERAHAELERIFRK